jgi:hypothetical protein
MSKAEAKVFLAHKAQTNPILWLDSGIKEKQEGTLGTPIVLTIRNTSRPRVRG